MIVSRSVLSSLAFTAAVAFAEPASATGMSDMAEAVAKCTAANPGVMLNTQTKEYVAMIQSPTAAASVPTTSSTPSYMKAMCRSDAMSQGGKPAFEGMQAKMGAMLMGLEAMHLSSAQRQKIDGMMHSMSTREMSEVHDVLTPAQRSQLQAVMRQMAFPGP